MVQRVQVVALGISLAIGAAVVAGLTFGSSQAPVRVGPTAMSAADQVEIYAEVLQHLAGLAPPGSGPERTVRVSRTLYDTCMPTPGGASPARTVCGRTKVGQLKPDIEAALHEALARRGLLAEFGQEGFVSLHQIVTEATGTPAVDGDDSHENSKFHFKRVGGRWQLQGVTPEWIAG